MILFHLEVIQVLSVPHVPSGGYVTFVFSVSNVLPVACTLLQKL